jgi:hypothetical protein
MMKSFWKFGVATVLFAMLIAMASVGLRSAEAAEPPKNAAAAADEGLVRAQRASSVDVTIYGNRFAQIEETRRVHLQAGDNRILLDGIAAHYRPDSLRVVDAKLVRTNVLNPKSANPAAGGPKAFSYLSATYRPANLTPDKLLAGSVGKRVTIKNASGAGSADIEGVLVNITGGMAVIQTDDGKTSILPAYNATLASAPKGLSNTAALVLEVWAAVEGDYDLNFLYDTDGITWNAKHSLIYDDEKSNVESWESSVAIDNNSGTTFEKATVRLLSSSVADAGGEGKMYRAGPMAESAGLRDASVESVGDQKSYTLPGEVALVEGQSRQVPLFRAANVPVKREYYIASDNGYYRTGKQEVSIRLEVDNCEAKNLGKALPSGSVKIYQRNKAGKLQLTGSARIGHKAVDEIFQMVIGTSSDIKWERLLVDRQEVASPNGAGAAGPKTGRAAPAQPNNEEVWELKTYKFVVSNFKRDRDVEVVIEVYFPTNQTVGAPWKLKDSIEQARTTLSVPKSGQSEVKLSVKERVR